MKSIFVKLLKVTLIFFKIIFVVILFLSFCILIGYFYWDILYSDKVLYYIYILNCDPITNQWLVFFCFCVLLFLFLVSNFHRYYLGYYNLDNTQYNDNLKNAGFFSRLKIIIIFQRLYDGLLFSIFVGCLKTEILKEDLVTNRYFESFIIQRVWDLYEKKCYLFDILNKRQLELKESIINTIVHSSSSLKELKLQLDIFLQQNDFILNLKKKKVDYCSDNNLLLEDNFDTNLQIENLYQLLENKTILQVNNIMGYPEKFKLLNIDVIIQEQIQNLNVFYSEIDTKIFTLLDDFKNSNLQAKPTDNIFIFLSNLNNKIDAEILIAKKSVNVFRDFFNALYNFAMENTNTVITWTLWISFVILFTYFLLLTVIIAVEIGSVSELRYANVVNWVIRNALFYNINRDPRLIQFAIFFRKQLISHFTPFSYENLILLSLYYLFERLKEEKDLYIAEKILDTIKNNPEEYLEFLKIKLEKENFILKEEDLRNYKPTKEDFLSFVEYVVKKKL